MSGMGHGKTNARALLAAMAAPPSTTVDMTGRTSLEWVEVRTDAGLIRVGVGLATSRPGEQPAPAVVIDVEPNIESAGILATRQGGDWELEIRSLPCARRASVVLARSS